MIAKTYSLIPTGFTATPVEIEGTVTHGLPNFNIVGMGSRTVSEARERVKSAIKSSGFTFPDQKLTINLAPADLEKSGTFLDLPIAINILLLTNSLRNSDLENTAFVGELSLDGSLRPVRGIISIVEAAKSLGITTIFIPDKNFVQASIIPGIEIIPATSLTDIYLHLKGQRLISVKNVVKNTGTDKSSPSLPTFDQIYGQNIAKRAITIAVAGRHNILLSGPPGTGKTMLARAGLSLLPPPTLEEQIAITKLHSLAGLTDDIVTSRPFRTPHHTSSLASLIGGGANATPGEISLAHLGVLFLDELPEYPRSHLESLRQPLEDRQITISRAKAKVTYPADFMLIATMNPCPCGYLGDPVHPCTCTETQISNYQKKLSGPLLDRIDLFVEVSRIDASKLLSSSRSSSNSISNTGANINANIPNPSGTSSTSDTSRANSTDSTKPTPSTQTVVKNTITDAITAQRHRFLDSSNSYNAAATPADIEQYFNLDSKAKALLDSAASQLDISARSYFKIIKVARTIADLERCSAVKSSHIAEALTFRQIPYSPT